MTQEIGHYALRGATGSLAVLLQGDPQGEAVVMTHSILSSSSMWDKQAEMLANRGFRVVRIDTIGHGRSEPPAAPLTMDDLAADTVAVLDALQIAQAHYIGLSLGGMSGFGLGVHHINRLHSLVLCDARADAPPSVAAPWNERIAVAERDGSCAPLADPTIERWFGRQFLDSNPELAHQFRATAAATSVLGFIACARAIQQLDYLDLVGGIAAPSTLIVGQNDGVLPDAMRELQQHIPGAELELIPDAGHLPNIDQPTAFNAALERHFKRCAA